MKKNYFFYNHLKNPQMLLDKLMICFVMYFLLSARRYSGATIGDVVLVFFVCLMIGTPHARIAEKAVGIRTVCDVGMKSHVDQADKSIHPSCSMNAGTLESNATYGSIPGKGPYF